MGQNCPARYEMRSILSFDPRPTQVLLRLAFFVLYYPPSCSHTQGTTWVSQKPSRSLVPRSRDKGGCRPGRHRRLYLGAIRQGMSRRLGRGCPDGWWIYLGRGSLFCCGRARARDFHWPFWGFLGCYLFAVDSQRQDCASRLCLMVRYLFLLIYHAKRR